MILMTNNILWYIVYLYHGFVIKKPIVVNYLVINKYNCMEIFTTTTK